MGGWGVKVIPTWRRRQTCCNCLIYNNGMEIRSGFGVERAHRRRLSAQRGQRGGGGVPDPSLTPENIKLCKSPSLSLLFAAAPLADSQRTISSLLRIEPVDWD